MGRLIPLFPLTAEQVDALFEQLVAIQHRLDDPVAQANPGFDVLALYGSQLNITTTLRVRGGLTSDEVAARFVTELAKHTAR